MHLLWDDTPLPKGVQVNIAVLAGEDTGRITIRGDRSLAAFFEGVKHGVFQAQEDDGKPVVRVAVTVEAVNFYAVADSPDEDAAAEIHGIATGAMPGGGFYS